MSERKQAGVIIEGAELATVIAALTFYRENRQGDPARRSDKIHDLATANDTVISLDSDGVRDLIGKLTIQQRDGHVRHG